MATSGRAGRAAVLAFDDAGLTRPEANDQAAREAGFADAAAYRRQQLRYWRAGLRRLLDEPITTVGAACVRNAQRFIEGGWAVKALDRGWTEQSLFWADATAPWARVDRLGAAYFGGTIRIITPDTITAEYSPGSLLNCSRVRGDGRGCAPWERQFHLETEQ